MDKISIQKLKFEPIIERAIYNGVQKIYSFQNGYGASVTRSEFTYGHESGLWEMAVIKWEDGDFEITYDTEITDDVIGYLTADEVEEYLNRISEL